MNTFVNAFVLQNLSPCTTILFSIILMFHFNLRFCPASSSRAFSQPSEQGFRIRWAEQEKGLLICLAISGSLTLLFRMKEIDLLYTAQSRHYTTGMPASGPPPHGNKEIEKIFFY